MQELERKTPSTKNWTKCSLNSIKAHPVNLSKILVDRQTPDFSGVMIVTNKPTISDTTVCVLNIENFFVNLLNEKWNYIRIVWDITFEKEHTYLFEIQIKSWYFAI